MTGTRAFVFRKEIFHDSIISGLSITKHFKFIKYVLITLLTLFDCKCLAQVHWQDCGSGQMPKMFKLSLSDPKALVVLNRHNVPYKILPTQEYVDARRGPPQPLRSRKRV